MAGTKRTPDQVDMMSQEALLLRISKIKSPRDAALAAFIYLTGARIGEILGTMKVITLKGKKPKKYMLRGLKKESIKLMADKDMILVQNVPCLKRRWHVPRRNIPIIISKEYAMVKIFWDYYKTIEPGEPLFNITRQRSWQIINKELGMYNHFLIHERCTHLVTDRGFSDTHLKMFRGWADTKMAAVYSHLQWEDVANRMKS